MNGSPSKRPRPSYEDGKLRDSKIAELQEQAAEAGDDQRSALLDLIRRVPTHPESVVHHSEGS